MRFDRAPRDTADESADYANGARAGLDWLKCSLHFKERPSDEDHIEIG